MNCYQKYTIQEGVYVSNCVVKNFQMYTVNCLRKIVKIFTGTMGRKSEVQNMTNLAGFWEMNNSNFSIFMSGFYQPAQATWG